MERVFGSPATFAISYRPFEDMVPGWTYAYVHLILAGELIGHADEYAVVGVWIPALVRTYHRWEKMIRRGPQSLFAGLSDREIFEVIGKSNQLEEEFDPLFLHLPAQETGELGEDHVLFLDETIDAYRLCVISRNRELVFLWTNCRLDTPFKMVSLPAFEALSTAREMILFCLKEYPELRTGTDRWMRDVAPFLNSSGS